VIEVIEKTICKENRAVNSRVNQSIEDDLKRHFAVLYELSQKFDDYKAIPTIPGDR
jgi:hypothetical protein